MPAVSPVEESAMESSGSFRSKSRWCRRRKLGEVAGDEKSSERGRYGWDGVVRRFISMPINAKGAQQASAQGLCV